MPLVIGGRFGSHEIVALLGAGGMSARGHASPRTWRSEGEHQRQFAVGVGPGASDEMMTPSPFHKFRWH